MQTLPHRGSPIDVLERRGNITPAARRSRVEARLRDLRRHVDATLGELLQELAAIERDESAAGDFLLDRDELESCERCGVRWTACTCAPEPRARS